MRARAKKGCDARVEPGARAGARRRWSSSPRSTAILCATAGAASAQEPSEPSSGGGVTSASSGGSGAADASESSSGGSSGSSARRLERAAVEGGEHQPGQGVLQGRQEGHLPLLDRRTPAARPQGPGGASPQRAGGQDLEARQRGAATPSTRSAGRARTGAAARPARACTCFGSASRMVAPRTAAAAKGAARFRLFPHKFPVRGAHQYWDGFGAGRNHMGQDLGARCGSKVVAARGGKVQWRGYQASGAGYYLVIDGKATEPRLRLHAPEAKAPPEGRGAGAHRPANRPRRHVRQLKRLPPALRDLVATRLVRGRARDAVGQQAPEGLGRLELSGAAAAGWVPRCRPLRLDFRACEPRPAFPAWSARPGHYESFYLKAARPDGRTGRLDPPHRPQAARPRSRRPRCG